VPLPLASRIIACISAKLDAVGVHGIDGETLRLEDTRRSSASPRVIAAASSAEFPPLVFQFQQPTGGGGGIVSIGGKLVQLALLQFEMLGALVIRMAAETEHPLDDRAADQAFTR
jgi:hypothetical protein